MKRLVACLGALVALALPQAGGARTEGESPLGMGPIQATFVEQELATHYTVEAQDLDSKPLHYRWILQLELVDRAGAPNPGVPNSGASVDVGCTNHGRLTGQGDEFVWRHGDPPRDSCNHQLMGPKGHQGSVVLVVTDGTWLCTAEYHGTNDGRGQAAQCRREDALAPTKIRSAIAKLQHSIEFEQRALDYLGMRPPFLKSARDNLDKGLSDLYDAQDLEFQSGSSDDGATLRPTFQKDLDVLSNITITDPPLVPKAPLDVKRDQDELQDAIIAKLLEVRRLRRVLRTQH